ncbi:MAG: DEAD/DEAH box helicase [Sedimentisphaerales bacterium]|nr:DEAD/DEAH box helicase [Sedimentisphaerales bacterium]
MKIADLDLRPEILRALEEKDYTELTPVQELTLPHVLSGRDLIARAETGSGKTAACGIPLVQTTDPKLDAVQGLILVPTRELALQYVSEISSIAKYSGVVPFAVYGGFSMQIQKGKLAHGVHILVATPGRLIDLLYNSPLRLSEVRTFVLDEADEMLDMGFTEAVDFIESCLIHEHQTLLFSATMPDEIKRIAEKYLNDPVYVELNVRQIAPENLEHWFYQTTPRTHQTDLLNYFAEQEPVQAIVFCNSRNGAEKLFSQLKGKLKSVEVIHGGLDQSRRTSLFRRFRNKQIHVMIATDVAGRGLDFSHVSHVINYDFPTNAEIYTHRTGRTARMGRKGTAVTFYTRRNLRDLKRLIHRNHVQPNWHGEEPDLDQVSTRKQGRKSYKGRRGKSSHSSSGRARTTRKPHLDKPH